MSVPVSYHLWLSQRNGVNIVSVVLLIDWRLTQYKAAL